MCFYDDPVISQRVLHLLNGIPAALEVQSPPVQTPCMSLRDDKARTAA